MTASFQPFRRILAHMDDTAHAAARIQLAARLAREYGSALCVTYSTLPGYALVPYGPDAAVSAVQVLRDIDDDRLRAARQRFDQECSQAHATADWAACCDLPVENEFVRQSLYADLLVLGQHDASDPQAGWVPPDFVEYVVSGSGKPALVLPHSMPLPREFGTVAIAWKETREAAHAVTAALPLLQRARRVVALSWGEDEAGTQPAFVRLGQYLRLHGVGIEPSHEGRETAELGELLLSRTADLGADLLVMGCYGHGRAREWALGGVSRTVMRSMTLPVLLSH
jgi:nucleotide-binding universal stress UspA family protein